MNSASQADQPSQPALGVSSRRLFSVLLRVAIVAVLFGLVGLSALAKDSIYLPRANAAHYINIANKMNVGQSPAVLDHAPPAAIAAIVPPAPAPSVLRQPPPEAVPVAPLGVVLSLQYRSPPAHSRA